MSRRRLATLAVVLGSLIGSTIAFGDFKFQPPLSFKPDDKAIGLGNTQASPDAQIIWETADADNHYMNAVVTGSSDLVVSQDAAIDWAVTGTNSLRIQSADSSAPTEYLGLRHDGTDVVAKSGSGGVKIEPASGVITLGDSVSNETVRIDGAAASVAQLIFNADGDSAGMVVDGNSAQFVVDVAANGGRQLILTDNANRAVDHQHDAETDPVLYIHSATSPAGDTTQYGSLSFSSANDQFNIGSGSAVVSIGADDHARWEFKGSTTTRPQLFMYGNNTEVLMLGAQTAHDQATLSVDDDAGNQLVFMNTVGQSGDCGHGPMTDPTLFVHSDQACAGAGANEWLAFSHDQTDAHIATGEGQIKLTAAADAGVIVPTEAAAVLNAPCAAANEGSIMYFDDTNDTGVGGFCGCVDADDGSNYAWAPLSNSAPCPS